MCAGPAFNVKYIRSSEYNTFVEENAAAQQEKCVSKRQLRIVSKNSELIG